MNKVAKDMSKVYGNTPTIDLIKNRQRKKYEADKLHGIHGYWSKKELDRLNHMIAQIDVELACRAAQRPLF